MPKTKQLKTWLELRKHQKIALNLMEAGAYGPATFHLRNVLRLNPEHADAFYLLSIVKRAEQEKQQQNNKQNQQSSSTFKVPENQNIEQKKQQKKEHQSQDEFESHEVATQNNQNKKQQEKQKEEQKQKNSHSQTLLKHAVDLNRNMSEIYDGKISKFATNQSNKEKISIQELKTKSDKINGKEESMSDINGDPKNLVNTWNAITEICINKGDISGAKAMFKAAFEYFNEAKAHNNGSHVVDRALGGLAQTGMHLYDLGFYEQGWDIIELIVAQNRKQYVYYNNLSILSYILGKYQEGKQLLAQSMTANPGYPRTHYIKAFVDMKNQEFDESLAAINLCVQKRPKTVFYHFKKFLILALGFLSGQPAEGLEQQRRQALTHQLQVSLSTGHTIMKQNKNDDSNLLRPKYVPFAKSAIDFIQEFYNKHGLAGFENQIYRNYLAEFDKFLIYGNTDRASIGKKLTLLEEVLRNNFGLAKEKIIVKDEDQIEQVPLLPNKKIVNDEPQPNW